MSLRNGDHHGGLHEPAAATAARPELEQTFSDPRGYRLVVEESPGTSKALPAPSFGRAKRRRSSDSPDDQKSLPKKPKNQQRGCYHLEPNPILRLLFNTQDPRHHYLQNPHLQCTVRLMEYDEDQSRWVLANQKIFGGLQTISLHIHTPPTVSRSHGRARATSGDPRQGYFVFSDLTVAAEGRYKLQYTLQEIQANGQFTQITKLGVDESHPFEVVKSTAHVKRAVSSLLAHQLKEGGVKLDIRKEQAKRKPKVESWHMENDAHIHIQRVMEAQPGCFEIVQNTLVPSTRPVNMPLMTPSRQQNEVCYSMMQPDLNNTSNSMAYPSTMELRTMPMAPVSGYAQYVDQKYPANGDLTYQLNGSSGEQSYGLIDGATYSAHTASTPTTQAYNALTNVPENTAYPPASGYMAPGAFFGMTSGTMSNGYQEPSPLGNMHMNRPLGGSETGY